MLAWGRETKRGRQRAPTWTFLIIIVTDLTNCLLGLPERAPAFRKSDSEDVLLRTLSGQFRDDFAWVCPREYWNRAVAQVEESELSERLPQKGLKKRAPQMNAFALEYASSQAFIWCSSGASFAPRILNPRLAEQDHESAESNREWRPLHASVLPCRVLAMRFPIVD